MTIGAIVAAHAFIIMASLATLTVFTIVSTYSVGQDALETVAKQSVVRGISAVSSFLDSRATLPIRVATWLRLNAIEMDTNLTAVETTAAMNDAFLFSSGSSEDSHNHNGSSKLPTGSSFADAVTFYSWIAEVGSGSAIDHGYQLTPQSAASVQLLRIDGCSNTTLVSMGPVPRRLLCYTALFDPSSPSDTYRSSFSVLDFSTGISYPTGTEQLVDTPAVLTSSCTATLVHGAFVRLTNPTVDELTSNPMTTSDEFYWSTLIAAPLTCSNSTSLRDTLFAVVSCTKETFDGSGSRVCGSAVIAELSKSSLSEELQSTLIVDDGYSHAMVIVEPESTRIVAADGDIPEADMMQLVNDVVQHAPDLSTMVELPWGSTSGLGGKSHMALGIRFVVEGSRYGNQTLILASVVGSDMWNEKLANTVLQLAVVAVVFGSIIFSTLLLQYFIIAIPLRFLRELSDAAVSSDGTFVTMIGNLSHGASLLDWRRWLLDRHHVSLSAVARGESSSLGDGSVSPLQPLSHLNSRDSGIEAFPLLQPPQTVGESSVVTATPLPEPASIDTSSNTHHHQAWWFILRSALYFQEFSNLTDALIHLNDLLGEVRKYIPEDVAGNMGLLGAHDRRSGAAGTHAQFEGDESESDDDVLDRLQLMNSAGCESILCAPKDGMRPTAVPSVAFVVAAQHDDVASGGIASGTDSSHVTVPSLIDMLLHSAASEQEQDGGDPQRKASSASASVSPSRGDLNSSAVGTALFPPSMELSLKLSNPLPQSHLPAYAPNRLKAVNCTCLRISLPAMAVGLADSDGISRVSAMLMKAAIPLILAFGGTIEQQRPAKLVVFFGLSPVPPFLKKFATANRADSSGTHFSNSDITSVGVRSGHSDGVQRQNPLLRTAPSTPSIEGGLGPSTTVARIPGLSDTTHELLFGLSGADVCKGPIRALIVAWELMDRLRQLDPEVQQRMIMWIHKDNFFVGNIGTRTKLSRTVFAPEMERFAHSIQHLGREVIGSDLVVTPAAGKVIEGSLRRAKMYGTLAIIVPVDHLLLHSNAAGISHARDANEALFNHSDAVPPSGALSGGSVLGGGDTVSLTSSRSRSMAAAATAPPVQGLLVHELILFAVVRVVANYCDGGEGVHRAGVSSTSSPFLHRAEGTPSLMPFSSLSLHERIVAVQLLFDVFREVSILPTPTISLSRIRNTLQSLSGYDEFAPLLRTMLHHFSMQNESAPTAVAQRYIRPTHERWHLMGAASRRYEPRSGDGANVEVHSANIGHTAPSSDDMGTLPQVRMLPSSTAGLLALPSHTLRMTMVAAGDGTGLSLAAARGPHGTHSAVAAIEATPPQQDCIAGIDDNGTALFDVFLPPSTAFWVPSSTQVQVLPDLNAPLPPVPPPEEPEDAIAAMIFPRNTSQNALPSHVPGPHPHPECVSCCSTPVVTGALSGELPWVIHHPHDEVSWVRSKVMLGFGSFSTVYSGLSNEGASVALKCVRLQGGSETPSTWATVLEDEVNTACSLVHDNIVRYHSWVLLSQHLVMVMERVSGGSLSALQRRFRATGGLPRVVYLKLARDCLRGLVYLHRQRVVHCDIKPHNVLVTPDGRAKLSDFGSILVDALESSRREAASDVTSFTGGLRGTALYMAPEVAAGSPCTTNSDVFAFGVMLFELACGGEHPWVMTSGLEDHSTANNSAFDVSELRTTLAYLTTARAQWDHTAEAVVTTLNQLDSAKPDLITAADRARETLIQDVVQNQHRFLHYLMSGAIKADPNHPKLVALHDTTLHDVIAKCLEIDPLQRSSAEALLQMPLFMSV